MKWIAMSKKSGDCCCGEKAIVRDDLRKRSMCKKCARQTFNNFINSK